MLKLWALAVGRSFLPAYSPFHSFKVRYVMYYLAITGVMGWGGGFHMELGFCSINEIFASSLFFGLENKNFWISE